MQYRQGIFGMVKLEVNSVVSILSCTWFGGLGGPSFCRCTVPGDLIQYSLSLSLYLNIRVLVHLSRAGADVSMYAPDIPQMHVLNHAKGEVMENETR